MSQPKEIFAKSPNAAIAKNDAADKSTQAVNTCRMSKLFTGESL
jgi:hypothetical protein